MNSINPDSISSISSQTINTGSLVANTTQANKNEFLQLMVAQLKNQNPLEPQNSAEFLSQLAQFSSVDGIERLNATLSDLSGGFRSSQILQATALVGRSVQAYLDINDPSSLVEANVNSVTVDQSGNVSLNLADIGAVSLNQVKQVQ